MKTLLLATHNKAKLEELRLGAHLALGDKVKIISLDDVKIAMDPVETGKTFEENSLLKARFYAEISRFPTIADDGGLIIPALDNEPGVKSRRWLGYPGTDEELINYTLHRLQGFPKDRRTAFLEVSLSYYDPQKKLHISDDEKIKGYIAEKQTGRPTNGYPFRALFIVERFNKYYDELTHEEHKEINHRLIALKRLLNKVRKYLIE